MLCRSIILSVMVSRGEEQRKCCVLDEGVVLTSLHHVVLHKIQHEQLVIVAQPFGCEEG